MVVPQLGERAKGQRQEVFALKVERGHHEIERAATGADDLWSSSGAGAEFLLGMLDQHAQAQRQSEDETECASEQGTLDAVPQHVARGEVEGGAHAVAKSSMRTV